MFDELLAELTAMNGDAKALLEKYDNAGVKLDVKTTELLQQISDAGINAIDAINTLLASGSVAQADNALKLEGKTVDELKAVFSIDTGFDKPDNDKPLFEKVTACSIKILLGSTIQTVSDYILDLNSNLDTGTKAPGTDYYVYALFENGFIISANKVNPSGYTTDNSKLLGGFHYGLTPEDELLGSYSATSPTSKTQADIDDIKGINKYSFWDLKLLPENGIPEGKALIQNTFWRDIYPADEDYGIRGFSSCFALAGGTAKIAGGGADNGRAIPKIPLSKGGNGTINYGKLTQFNAVELVASCGMELASYAEFQESSFGVVEEKSANDLGYTTNGVISHIPELTSKYGIEMASSTQWFWTKNLLNGYGNGDFAYRAGLTDGRGTMYIPTNGLVSLIVGDAEQGSSTSMCGSRAVGSNNYLWASAWDLGFLGVCRNMKQI